MKEGEHCLYKGIFFDNTPTLKGYIFTMCMPAAAQLSPATFVHSQLGIFTLHHNNSKLFRDALQFYYSENRLVIQLTGTKNLSKILVHNMGLVT
jgi:hypothetical protein